MAQRGSVRHMFPGGNTAHGFFSFYDNVVGDNARRAFILKGGPGTGKSTFMTKIADELVSRGFACELHHCSADPDSVDAVVFPELGIALLDGTAPHIIDPDFPGLLDEIVDLGRYLDEKSLRSRKEDILHWKAAGKQHYGRAYSYLAAAKHVRDNVAATQALGVDAGLVHGAARRVADELVRLATSRFRGHRPAAGPGKRRRLFISSITPDGFRHHLPTLVDGFPHVFVVRGGPGTGTEQVLERAAAAVADLGLDAELFSCALEPERLEHLVVPELGAAVVTSRPPHDYEPPGAVVVDLNEQVARTDADAASAQARRLFDELMHAALDALSEAKRCHLQVEALYAPAVDFDGVEELRQRIRDRIFAYIDG